MRLKPGFWIASNWPEIEKNYDDVIICWRDIIVKFFDVFVFFLSRLVLPNIWQLAQVRNTKFGFNVSNEMLLNAFTISELLRENQQGWVKIIPTRIRVNWILAST